MSLKPLTHDLVGDRQNGVTPDHLNLLSLDESFADLQTISWNPSRLLDDTFVPLGIAP